MTMKMQRRRSSEELDELDEKIMRLLRQDGRIPSAQIARNVRASDATVRYRINRLKARGFIVTMTMPMAARVAQVRIVAFFIRTVPGKTMDFVNAIKSMPCIRFLGIGSGSYDVYLSAGFETDEELLEFRHNIVGASDAVERFETLLVLKIVTRTYDLIVPEGNESGA